MSDRFVSAFKGATKRAELSDWVRGTLGRKLSDGSYEIIADERNNLVYVTIRHANGAQTAVTARNDDGVPHNPNLAVKMKLEYGVYVIYGRTGVSEGGVINRPSDPSGLPVHTHAHSALTGLTSGDDHPQYLNQERGDASYFPKDDYLTTSSGSADEGFPVVLNSDGEIDPSMLKTLGELITGGATDDSIQDTDVFPYSTAGVAVKTAWSNIKSLIGTYIASAVLTLTNKTLDSTNISSLTAKTTPVDADSAVIVDSEASNVFKRTTYTNIKAFLKTYFDTLYGLLAGTNTWTGANTFQRAGTTVFRRTGGAVDQLQGAVQLIIQTTGAMTDGFGTGFLALARDDSGVDNPSGIFGWVRDGADDTYEWDLYNYIAGVATKVLNVDSAAFSVLRGSNLYLRDPDVAHGLTTLFPTDVYGRFSPISGTEGGLSIEGASDAVGAVGLFLKGYIGNTDPTDTVAALSILGAKKSGTTGAALGSSETVFAFDNWTTRIATVLGSGFWGFGSSPTTPTNWLHVFLGTGNTTNQGVQVSGQANGFIRFGNGTSTSSEFLPVIHGRGSTNVNFGFFLIGAPPDDASDEAAVRISARTVADGILSNAILLEVFNFSTRAFTIMPTGKAIVGDLTPSGVGANILGIKAGTSTNDAAVGGVLYQTTTTTGNITTGEDDLASYSVPANTLAVNGQSLWFEAWGTYANNANAKTLRVRFGTSGTNLVVDESILTGAAGTWRLRGRIYRTGAATQKGFGEVLTSGNANDELDTTTALNQTLSGAVTLKVTGEATSTDDIVLEAFIVGWNDANS